MESADSQKIQRWLNQVQQVRFLGEALAFDKDKRGIYSYFVGYAARSGLLREAQQVLDPETEVEVLVMAYHSYVQVPVW